VEIKRHGGVVISPNAPEPVIMTAKGYQYNGLFYADLKDLDPGTYRLVDGEPVSFDVFWESGKSWAELVEARP
jgi:hypothetical protein